MHTRTCARDSKNRWKSLRKCIGNAIEKAMRSGSEFLLIWLALGALLGTIWHPDASQKAPKTHEVTPKFPKECPRSPKDYPRCAKSSPKSAQEATKSPQEAPKRPQRSPKRAPRPPGEAPKSPQEIPKTPQSLPKRSPRHLQSAYPVMAKSRKCTKCLQKKIARGLPVVNPRETRCVWHAVFRI